MGAELSKGLDETATTGSAPKTRQQAELACTGAAE